MAGFEAVIKVIVALLLTGKVFAIMVKREEILRPEKC